MIYILLIFVTENYSKSLNNISELRKKERNRRSASNMTIPLYTFFIHKILFTYIKNVLTNYSGKSSSM